MKFYIPYESLTRNWEGEKVTTDCRIKIEINKEEECFYVGMEAWREIVRGKYDWDIINTRFMIKFSEIKPMIEALTKLSKVLNLL
jgi:hypothetical protein